jgi:hypothetical protein
VKIRDEARQSVCVLDRGLMTEQAVCEEAEVAVRCGFNAVAASWNDGAS